MQEQSVVKLNEYNAEQDTALKALKLEALQGINTQIANIKTELVPKF